MSCERIFLTMSLFRRLMMESVILPVIYMIDSNSIVTISKEKLGTTLR